MQSSENDIDFWASWGEHTFDSKGNELTFKDVDGFWTERTYDSKGNQLTYKNSDGFWFEYTYDLEGKRLTVEEGQILPIPTSYRRP